MAANGTPQSALYSGYGAMDNPYRDRSSEQAHTTSGNPMNYIPNFNDPMYGTQQPSLGRYVPPMMSTYNNGSWNGQGGYAYNLPTSFGPYGGAWGSPYSIQGPQSFGSIQGAGGFPGGYQGQPQMQPQQGYGMPQIAPPQGGAPGQPQQGSYVPRMPGVAGPQAGPAGAPTQFGSQLGSYMGAPAGGVPASAPAALTALQQAQGLATQMQQNPAWLAHQQQVLAAAQNFTPSAGSNPARGIVPNFNLPYGQSPFASMWGQIPPTPSPVNQ